MINNSVIQICLSIALVLERICNFFFDSKCYKHLSFKPSLGNFEIESEEAPETDKKEENKE